jgi:hypothetical protein
MEFSEDAEITFDHNDIDRAFLVCAGYLVWVGLLCLYRLALGCKGKTWFN